MLDPCTPGKRRITLAGYLTLHHETAPLCEDTVMEEFEEFDEDGLVDSDDDDNSWKVRRAALKVLQKSTNRCI